MTNIKEEYSEEKSDLEQGFTKILLTTFTTVFVAELGDKTQVATMLLTAHSGHPLIIFIGASIALICTSILSVLLGSWLSKNITPDKLNLSAGLVMILIGLSIIYQVLSAPGSLEFAY